MADLNLEFDRYLAVRELGRGGAAVVYEAVHQGLGTRHALKLLSVQSEVVRKRMMREARLQASLKHPNLVAVTDVFEVDQRPVVIMDLVDGPTLEEWLIEGGLPSPEEAERIFRGIVAGVAAAHDQGVVHRDLKPANVMLELIEGRVEPRVTDFGLAKALARKKTETKMGVAMGTPGYMAPELIERAATADERADIFSLGCILYAMLAGVIPFAGENVLDSLNRTAEGRYTPLRELAPNAPDRLSRVVKTCLVVDRDERPASCGELLAILGAGRPFEAPVQPDLSPRPQRVPLIVPEVDRPSGPTLWPDPEPDPEPESPAKSTWPGVGLAPEPTPRATPRPSEPAPPPAASVRSKPAPASPRVQHQKAAVYEAEGSPPAARRVVGVLLLLAGLALLVWMGDLMLDPEPGVPTTTLPGER